MREPEAISKISLPSVQFVFSVRASLAREGIGLFIERYSWLYIAFVIMLSGLELRFYPIDEITARHLEILRFRM